MSIAKVNPDRERYLRIKAALLTRQRTFSGIARKLGVSLSAVSQVASGACVSRRIRLAIARACAIPYRILWEEHTDA